jgi:peptide/nickel transport system ATP-binding protein
VADNLCERELPQIKVLEGGHHIKCHLSDQQLAQMEAVIKTA